MDADSEGNNYEQKDKTTALSRKGSSGWGTGANWEQELQWQAGPITEGLGQLLKHVACTCQVRDI